MLPRTKSRKITVDGVEYRWGVSEARTGKSALFVSRADGKGSRLEVKLIREIDTFFWMPLPLRSPGPITPRLVALLMAAVREAGWVPSEPGPTFVFAK